MRAVDAADANIEAKLNLATVDGIWLM